MRLALVPVAERQLAGEEMERPSGAERAGQKNGDRGDGPAIDGGVMALCGPWRNDRRRNHE